MKSIQNTRRRVKHATTEWRHA